MLLFRREMRQGGHAPYLLLYKGRRQKQQKGDKKAGKHLTMFAGFGAGKRT